MSDELQARDAQFAAEWDADVNAEQIAEVYAEAFLNAAQNVGDVASCLEELESLVTDVLDVFPDFEAVLASGVVPHHEKEGIIERTLGGRATPVLLNFLMVLSRRGRLDCLRAIAAKAKALHDQRLGRVPVRVTAAEPLSEDLLAKIKAGVAPLVAGEPVLEVEVDPSLIGGVKIRVGDTVYDASVAAQLAAVRKQIIDRSAHEIQSRRDRFRDPAGN
ncbi:ATP synthase F1 subunit delta [Thermostilla marina]